MLLLVVWIAVAVVTVVVLGGLLLSLRGAQQRLRRELDGLQGDLAPTLAQVAATRDRAAEVARTAGERRGPA